MWGNNTLNHGVFLAVLTVLIPPGVTVNRAVLDGLSTSSNIHLWHPALVNVNIPSTRWQQSKAEFRACVQLHLEVTFPSDKLLHEQKHGTLKTHLHGRGFAGRSSVCFGELRDCMLFSIKLYVWSYPYVYGK